MIGINELIILFFLFGLVPFIFFLVTQQNTLKAIQAGNRGMSPGEVWLSLIPLFGLIWQFMVVSRIADSIQRELSSQTTFSFEQPGSSYSYSVDRPTYGIGMAYCTLICCSIIPYLGSLTSIAAIVCWIIYWVQLANYKSRIQIRQASSNSPGTPQY